MRREEILKKGIEFLTGNLEFNETNVKKVECFIKFKGAVNETSYKIALGNAKSLIKRFANRKNIYSCDRKLIETFVRGI